MYLQIDSTKTTTLILEHRLYGGTDKSLARPTSRCILFDG